MYVKSEIIFFFLVAMSPTVDSLYSWLFKGGTLTSGAAVDYGLSSQAYIARGRRQPSHAQLVSLASAYAVFIELNDVDTLKRAFDSRKVHDCLCQADMNVSFKWVMLSYMPA